MKAALRNAGGPEAASDFKQVAKDAPRRKKPASPLTLRLTEDERARLSNLAAGQPVSTYVRACIFGKDTSPRKKRVRAPVKDHMALAQVLGLLGQTHIANNLNQIAFEANCGSLLIDDETEQEIKLACAHIAFIRVKLIEALGLKDQSKR